jgi:hypothetical protein
MAAGKKQHSEIPAIFAFKSRTNCKHPKARATE